MSGGDPVDLAGPEPGVTAPGRPGPGVGVRCRDTGVSSAERVDPCVFVLFGASGDLGRRQIVPSLLELAAKDLLPEPFAVLGAAKSGWDDAAFRRRMEEALEREVDHGDLPSEAVRSAWDDLVSRLHYLPVDVTSGPEDDYRALARKLREVRETHGLPDNALFHLAVPPSFFTEIVEKLGESGLATSREGWRRLVVEKPFGEDRASARELDDRLLQVFPEDRIYRIDHFLGKETVQNLLVFRFANPAWEPVWNRNYIDHVQITAAEDIGVGRRSGFYEETGVVRDMVQNHLLQLLCMTAIEPPVRCLGTSVRDETVKVLRAVEPVDPVRDFVGGQYGPGEVAGEVVPGYRGAEGVDPESTTPTYAALELRVDNWRWAGVPFYLRTGKRMTRKLTEIVIQFRPTPHAMFPGQDEAHRNVLAFRLQPHEGIVQRFAAKRPGPSLRLEPVQMNFRYASAFGVDQPPRAYAWLLLDAMRGDQTLFARSDWIQEAWSIVDPIVDHWNDARGDELPNYEAGSWGPEAAGELLAREGREWTEI